MGRKKNFKFEWRVKKKLDVPSTSAPPPPWTELPRDVTANILQRLGAIEILESAQKVCTTWRSVCKDSLMWRVIDMTNSGDPTDIPYDLDVMCRRAVDLSQGQLIDINIEYFGSDELLHYISERCTRLKRLRLASSYEISGKGLSEAVKKFPQLSELHLFFIPLTYGRDIESIGRSCPLLNSFSFNNRGYRSPLVEQNDEHALAIAENMPNLRRLRLFGNRMTNSGLEAILARCPNLESLDIRQCFNVDLTGDLGKLCARQISDLKCPNDSVADYKFDASIPITRMMTIIPLGILMGTSMSGTLRIMMTIQTLSVRITSPIVMHVCSTRLSSTPLLCGEFEGEELITAGASLTIAAISSLLPSCLKLQFLMDPWFSLVTLFGQYY